MRHHTKKTSQTRPPLKIYNKNTNSLQLPGSSEALAVCQRICTELYFTCIYSVFFPQGLLRLYSYRSKFPAVPKCLSVAHLYLQVTTLQHTHLLYFSPQKTKWSPLACPLFPRIFANPCPLTTLQKKTWQTFPNPEYWSHSGYAQ